MVNVFKVKSNLSSLRECPNPGKLRFQTGSPSDVTPSSYPVTRWWYVFGWEGVLFFREYWKLKWFKPWKQWLSRVDIWSRLAWLRLFEKSKHSFLSSSPLSFEFKLLQNCECPLKLNWKSGVSAQLNATFSPILYTVIYFLLLPIPSIWQVVGVPIVEN